MTVDGILKAKYADRVKLSQEQLEAHRERERQALERLVAAGLERALGAGKGQA